MIQTKLRLPEKGLLNALLPRLEGRVFHVTLLTTLDLILRSEEIRPNNLGPYDSPFGSSNSFFRNRGCVSLFDYRSVTPEELDDSLRKCSPIQPIQARLPDSGIAIFLLSPLRCLALLPWSLWKQEEAGTEVVVPYVEAGHEGPISLALVDEVICVEVELDEECGRIIAALWRGNKQRNVSD